MPRQKAAALPHIAYCTMTGLQLGAQQSQGKIGYTYLLSVRWWFYTLLAKGRDKSMSLLATKQGPDLVRRDEDGLHHGAGRVGQHHVAVVDLLHRLRHQDLVRNRDLLLRVQTWQSSVKGRRWLGGMY